MQNKEFVKEQLDIACDALRKIGAVVEICPDSMKITIVSDLAVLSVEDDSVRLSIDGHDITSSVRELIIRSVPGQYPDMRMVFKPKISIRRIKR
jgi:hypothetical protein